MDREQATDVDESPRRPLLRDRAFWGLTLTQFLGAFNDNVYKQTLLLLFTAVPIVTLSGKEIKLDLQGLGSFIFALPFLCFSGLAGYLSDRGSKRYVIFLCKVAERAIMLVGCAIFALHARTGMSLGMTAVFFLMLFFMGSHSAFFGPGKYGILPELFRERDLPVANGLILMTTFLAVIFGTFLAGTLKKTFPDDLWIIGLVCCAIAIAGIASSLMIPRTPAARPELRFSYDYLVLSRDMRSLMRSDRALGSALWTSSFFWMAAVMVLLAVNSLGKTQFHADDFITSLLVAAVSVGIAIGSVVTGFISGGKFNLKLLKLGAWGLIGTLLVMALPGPYDRHLLGLYGTPFALILIGAFTGMFAVPLQFLIQVRPPRELKGETIAAMNFMNWTGIVLGGVVYQAIVLLLSATGRPPAEAFFATALCMIAAVLTYHPPVAETPPQS